MLERLEGRIAPSVVDDMIGAAIASLNTGPSIPVASSVMQQPEVGILLHKLVADAEANLQDPRYYKQSPPGLVMTRTANPVHEEIDENPGADFAVPLGSFMTLSSPEKVKVHLVGDYVLAVQLNVATKEATILDGNLKTTNPLLPPSTMAVEAIGGLPTTFNVLGSGNTLFVSGSGLPDTKFDVTYAVNLGTFSIGTVVINPDNSFVLPDSLPAGSAPKPDVKLNGQAHADFDLKLDGDVDPSIPFRFGLAANLTADWSFANAQVAPNPDKPFGTLVDLDLHNVTIDLGTLTTFIGNFVQDIQSVTAAPGIQQIVDLFGTKLPLATNTFGDFAAAHGLLPGGIADAIDAIELINNLKVTPQSGTEDLGNFSLSDPRDPATFHITAFSTNPQTADAPKLIQDLNNILGTAFGQGNDPTIGLHFPLLTDPAGTLDQLLVGKNVTLATFKTPDIDFHYVATLASVFSDLGVGLTGDIRFHLQASLGYDAAGLLLDEKDNDTSNFDHGFYFDAANTSADITGNITLTAGLGVTVSGGIFANATIRPGGVPDPTEPNKRRLDALLHDGDCMFDASGKVYIQASVGAGVGPFSTPGTNIAYKELASFRNDCNALATSLPLNIVPRDPSQPVPDHVLMLQTAHIKSGDAVHVKPFINKSLSENDPLLYSGIEVDYSDATYAYVETRDGIPLNHYDTIGADGAIPATGTAIDITDPFGVFAAMKLPNPSSATPRVVLVGSFGDDTLEYHDGGSKAQVLFVGGGGNNVLLGGSLMIANYVTSKWTDTVNALLPTVNSSDSSADQSAESLIGQEIDGVTDTAGTKPGGDEILIATGDSTLVGGAGTNRFDTQQDSDIIKPDSNNINLWGGKGGNNFIVYPSVNGTRNNYIIHGGGPGSGNSLVIAQGHDPTVMDAELDINVFASDVPDDFDPTKKALAVSDATGIFALAHGVEGLSVLPDSATIPTVIGVGDLSETAVTKNDIESHRARDRTVPLTEKFLGSSGDDVFTLTADPVNAGDQRLAVLTLTIHYGSTGGTFTSRIPGPLPFDHLAFDGGAGSDTYNLNLGVGTNFTVDVDDSSPADPNTLNINGFTAPTGSYLHLDTLSVNDESIKATFHTPHFPPDWASSVHGPLTSVSYALQVNFNTNISLVNVNSAGAFRDVVVDRPTAKQEVDLNIGYAPEEWVLTALAVALDGTSPDERIDEGGGGFTVSIDQVNSFNVLSNAGTLDITSPLHYPFDISGDTGTVTFDSTGSNIGPVFGGFNVATGGFYFYAFANRGPDSLTIGAQGSLAGVTGTIDVVGSFARIDLVLDDSNDPASEIWALDASGIEITGGLTLNYAATRPGAITFDSIRLLTSPNSSVHLSDLTLFGPLYYRIAALEVDGGGTNSTLQGPDGTNNWDIVGTDQGTLNNIVTWNGFDNLTGGSGEDTFAFHDTSLVTGAINGGGDSDFLDYTAYSQPFVADLSTGKAPLIDGSVSNVEAIIPVPLSLSAPSQTVAEGAAVSIQVTATSAFHLAVGVIVTGLPSWLVFNSSTGLISGVAPTGSGSGSPYMIQVSAQDSIGNSRMATIEVFVNPVPVVTPLTGLQSAVILQQYQATLALRVTDPLGNPIPSVPVVFQVIPSQTGAGATFGSLKGPTIFATTTGPIGIAKALPLWANANVGSFFVNATLATGKGVAVFPLNNIASLASDTTPPTTLITSHPMALDPGSAGSFTFTGNDDVTAPSALAFQVNLDNSPWQSVSSSNFAYQNLADGPHVFQVRAIDAAGNVDLHPPSYSWTIDATPPTLTLPADQDVAATTPDGANVDFPRAGATDPHGPVILSYSAAPGSLFALGTTPVTVEATDALGNHITGNFNVVVEDAAPTVSIGSAPKPLTSSRSADFELNVSDAVTPVANLVVETNLDGLGWVSVTGSTQHFDNLAEGPHTFELRATNPSGHRSTIASASWTIDTTPPDLTVPPDQTVEAVDATGAIVTYPAATASDLDDVASLNYSQDSNTLFPLGTTIVSVTAIDGLGNSVTKMFDVVVRDTTPPVISITQGPNPLTASPDAHFEFLATDAVTASAALVVEAKLDKQDWQAISGTALDLANLPAGAHTLLLKATDAAGNKSTPTSFNWTIDDTPPTLTVPPDVTVEATGPNGATVNYGAISASDDSGLVRIFASQDSGTVFPVGKTIVTVNAFDPAGNETTGTFAVVVQAPTQLAFVAQPSDSTAGVAINPAITVEVLDQFGNLIVGDSSQVTIAIGSNPGGGTLSGTQTVAAIAGVATFNDLSIDKSGMGYTLGASDGSLGAATSSSFTINPGEANQLAFGVQPSDSTAGVAISPAVTVEVLDTFGNLVVGDISQISIAVGSNPGGTLSGTTMQPASAGVASFNDLSIDKAGSGYTLFASSNGLTGVSSNGFDITPAGADHLLFNQQPTNTTAGQAIAPAVTVQIVDQFNNVVNSSASVSVAIGTNPNSGTLSGTTTQSASAGVASFNDLSIDQAGSGYTLFASSTGLTVTSMGFNITATAADHLLFLQQPTDTVAGTTISPAVTVQIVDQFGNLTNSSANVSLAIGTNPSSGTLSGTTTKAASSGVATFGDLSINKASIGYTLMASSSGLTGTTSMGFNIEAAAADHLLFLQQPTDTVAGTSITPAVTVEILDRFNNLTTSGANVSVAIGTNPNSGTLSGTTTQAASSGIATFGDLSINKAGMGYTLGASDGSLGVATSSSFTIKPAAADHLAFGVQPSNSTAGVAISPAVTVKVLDRFGNLATGDTSSLTMAIGTNPSGGTLSGTQTMSAVGGVATFSTLSIDKAGTGYTLTASDGSLTGAVSNPFNVTSSQQGATSTVVSSSANPAAVFGQPITFTAAVSAVSGQIPTGTVQFMVDGANLGTAVPLNATGQAVSPVTSFLSGASHSVTAVYSGGAGFLASKGSFAQIVQQVAVELDPANPALHDLFVGDGSNNSDKIQVNPFGNSNTGSTGVQLSASFLSSSMTFQQSFFTIYVYLQGGSDSVILANSLTVNAHISAGNGNDTVKVGSGSDFIALGNGNDIVTLGDQNNSTIILGNGNDNLTLGNGNNDSVTLGNGNDTVLAGSGAGDILHRGTGKDAVQTGSGWKII
jgi:hypothetical protein